MKRQLTILVGLAVALTSSVAFAQTKQEPCEDGKKSDLAAIVAQFVQELPTQQDVLRQEAIQSGHLYILDVAGEEVCLVLRDPTFRGAPFQIELPLKWKPILEGTEPAKAKEIVAAIRSGFDQLVEKIKKQNADGVAVGQDTETFQALGGKITAQYLDELMSRLRGSGASDEVQDAGRRLKAAADARLAGEANPYSAKGGGGDEAEAADVKSLYGYLAGIKMVVFK